jgi:MbtH protein
MENEIDEQGGFNVVVNDEEQYSIWRDGKPLPEGWREVGKKGSKSECLSYIDSVWTDMRPLSLRRRLAETNR